MPNWLKSGTSTGLFTKPAKVPKNANGSAELWSAGTSAGLWMSCLLRCSRKQLKCIIEHVIRSAVVSEWVSQTVEQGSFSPRCSRCCSPSSEPQDLIPEPPQHVHGTFAGDPAELPQTLCGSFGQYMRIYDDVPVNERSPTSTLTTDMCASSPTSSIGTQCPIYENVNDFAPLAAQYIGSTSPPFERSQRLNIDFINHIPPPPLSNSDLDKSSSDYGTNRRSKRPLDMRPLSLPASERKRLEQKSHNVLLAVIGSTIICMTLFLVAVWYYYADIQKHLRSLTNSL